MKPLDQATTRELEIQQVRIAIEYNDIQIFLAELALARMRRNQTARRCELVRQETLARMKPVDSAPPP